MPQSKIIFIIISKVSLILFFLLLIPALLSGQDVPPDSATASRKDAVRIFIDCSYCSGSDFDFFKTELGFVDFVRDRALAEVDLLFSSQQTGGGGDEHTITFVGQMRFAGMDDTLKCVVDPTASEDQARHSILQLMKIGLMRYVSHSGQADQISISYSVPMVPTETKDKWDHWVFTMSGNGYFNGEQTYHSQQIWGSLSASRVTEALRLNGTIYYSDNKDVFETDDGQIVSTSDSKEFDGFAAISLTNHWSAGPGTTFYTSSYSNTKLSASIYGQLEYNIFPYSESTSRQLRLSYSLSLRNVTYEEETIYGETAENLFSEGLSENIKMIQPWGSVSFSLSGSHYLHDFKKNRLQVYGDMSFKIFKGLSLNMSGSISRLHNQLALRKGSASDDQILLKRRELETSYSYWTSFGISYSLGSIYSEIVNPRFGY